MYTPSSRTQTHTRVRFGIRVEGALCAYIILKQFLFFNVY